MTSKRFHKLFRGEMTKLMAHKEGAAGCIKGAARCTPLLRGHYSSYQEAWDALRPLFTTKDYTPPLK